MKKYVIVLCIFVSVIYAQKIINPVTSASSLTKGTVVAMTASNIVTTCDATDQPAGVINVVETVGATTYYHLMSSGIATGVGAATDVVAGDVVVTAGSGKIQKQTALTGANYVVGVALEDILSGTSGKIMLMPNTFAGDGSPVGTPLTSGQIWVGDASNTAQEVAMSGDVTMTAAGVTEIFPNIVSTINDVSNDESNIDIIGGSNITVTPDDVLNTITIDATDVDNYDYWSLSIAGGLSENVTSLDNVDIAVSGDLDITRTALNLVVAHEDTGFSTGVDNSDYVVIQDITVNSNGHVTGVESIDLGPSLTSLWEDDGSYIDPTEATYPYIYDDNSSSEISGNATQLYLETSGTNTEAGLYVYSNPASSLDKGSWIYDISRSLIKAYDAQGDQYNSAISGYSDLSSINSAAVIGYGTNSTYYTLPAMMYGDFYNQGASAAVSVTSGGSSWTTLQTANLTTHSTGVANSIVMVNASATLTTTLNWQYPGNDRWGIVYLRVLRDGATVVGSSQALVGFQDDYYVFGGKESLAINTYDEPAAGDHTYVLQYLTGYGLTFTDTTPNGLVVFELKN